MPFENKTRTEILSWDTLTFSEVIFTFSCTFRNIPLLTTSSLQEFHYKLQQLVIRDWISQNVSYMINWCRQGSLSQHRLWQKVKRHKSFGKMKLRQSKSKANISWTKWNRQSGPEPKPLSCFDQFNRRFHAVSSYESIRQLLSLNFLLSVSLYCVQSSSESYPLCTQHRLDYLALWKALRV